MKAINQTTQEAVYFNSMYAVQQHLGINAGIVKMICEGVKLAFPKKFINLCM